MSQVKRTLVHDSKPVSQGAILSFNIPSFETIDDVILQFTNNGAPASLTNIKSSIGKIALSINGQQVVNAPITEIFAVYESLGNEVSQNLSNCVGLNIGRYLFKDAVTEDFFAYIKMEYVNQKIKPNSIKLLEKLNEFGTVVLYSATALFLVETLVDILELRKYFKAFPLPRTSYFSLPVSNE